MVVNYLVDGFVTNESYLKAIASCGGEGTINEITEDGDLEIALFMPHISEKEIILFNNFNPTVYFYENDNKSAIFFDFKISKHEIVVNPTYYNDERWEKFDKGYCKELIVYLLDSATMCIVAGRVFEVRGNILTKIRESFAMNASHTKNELEVWKQAKLYKNCVEDNIKRSSYVGRCREMADAKIVLT